MNLDIDPATPRKTNLGMCILKTSLSMPRDAFPRVAEPKKSKSLDEYEAASVKRLHASGVWTVSALAKHFGVTARHLNERVLG